MIGQKRGTVQIIPYTDEWAKAFERERALLQPIFGNHELLHVGSTAVVGLPSKPIIDMLVGLDALSDFEQYRSKLETLGYISMPEREKEWEIFIPKGPDEARTHYLHVMVKDSPEYRKVITFRDHLRTDDADREAYAHLKKALAEQYPNDRRVYTASKVNFIERCIEKAQE